MTKKQGTTYVDGNGHPWLVTDVGPDRLTAKQLGPGPQRVHEFTVDGGFDPEVRQPDRRDLRAEANAAGGSAHERVCEREIEERQAPSFARPRGG